MPWLTFGGLHQVKGLLALLGNTLLFSGFLRMKK